MKKRHRFIAISICLSALCFQACSDESSEDNSKDACTAADNKCIDAKTIRICEDGALHNKDCAYGCENGACKEPAKCAASDNGCKDETTLSICDENTGVIKERECAYGCENSACKQQTKCVAADNKCKDETMLSACDENTGVIKERECAYGCKDNACASGACAAADNKCIDDNTAQICDAGALYRENCAYGCENGTCKAPSCAVSDNECGDDGKTLSACDTVSGIMKERECAYGCKDNACASGACTDDDNKCIDDNTAQICGTGALYREKCAHGCENGTCKAPSCAVSDNKCSDDGKTLSACDTVSGVMKERECAYGCKDNACVTEACAAAADNKCIDSNTAQICDAGALYRETCAYGCDNETAKCKEPPKCIAADNACKDEKTLSACDETAGLMKERECAYGCKDNACASGACTDDDNKCIDDNTAQICGNGALYREKCAHGCENGTCKAPSCAVSDNKCGDDGKTLSACDETSGLMKERECAYGCKDNACVTEACAAAADNKCIDSNTAQICDAGALYRETCAYGCDNETAKCKEPPKCVAADNACKDEKTLSACDETSGLMKERECAYGCKDNACVPTACDDDDNICIDNNTAQRCESGTLYREKCDGGCQKGACRSVGYGALCNTDDFETFCLSNINGYAACENEYGSNVGKIVYNTCGSQLCLTSADKKYAGCYGETDGLCSDKPYCNSWDGSIRSNCMQMSDGTTRYNRWGGETVSYCPAACEKNASGEAICANGVDGENKKCSNEMWEICRNRGVGNCGIVGGKAKCFNDTCKKAGLFCDYYSEDEISVAKQCVQTDAGTTDSYGNAVDFIKINEETCDLGCASDNTCKKSTDDGKTCSADAAALCKTGEMCALLEGKAVCYDADDKCDPSIGDKTRDACEGANAIRYVCAFADDGETLLWKRNSTEYCADRGDGYTCDPLTAACSNNVCNDSFIKYCKITSDDGCATYGGIGYCSRAEADCKSETVGKTKEVCTGETNPDGTPVLARYQCIKIADASGETASEYVWAKLSIDAWNLKSCPFGCTANACIEKYEDGAACSAEQSDYCKRLSSDAQCMNRPYDWYTGCYENGDGTRMHQEWYSCENGISYRLRETIAENKSSDGSYSKTDAIFVNINKICGSGCHPDGQCMEDTWDPAIKCADRYNFNEWDVATEQFGSETKSCASSEYGDEKNKYCSYNRCTDHYCGDGNQDWDEACDNGTDNGAEGSSCSKDCTEIRCGNNKVDAGEECDEGDGNNGSGESGCTSICKKSFCGDGEIEFGNGEECDDGEMNGKDESSCSASCTKK